jgi:hypothetical protein
MTLETTIDESSLRSMETGIVKTFEKIQQPVEEAMAKKFHQIVLLNLGQIGIDRPFQWDPLSDRSEIGREYIRKVGRTYATLLETGALQAAIHQDGNKVSVNDSEVPYAVEVQVGNPAKNLPPRPAFPIDSNGNALPFTQGELIRAAIQELDLQLGGGEL